jgi:glycosyltransferase involved in cell wall biosynthesis
VIPYPLTTLNHRFCCPNKLSQYMQAGLAILSTNSSFVEGILRQSNAGLTYEVTTPDSVVTAVRALLDAPQQLGIMQRNALAFANSEFNWQSQSTPYLNAISRLFYASTAAA